MLVRETNPQSISSTADDGKIFKINSMSYVKHCNLIHRSEIVPVHAMKAYS